MCGQTLAVLGILRFCRTANGVLDHLGGNIRSTNQTAVGRERHKGLTSEALPDRVLPLDVHLYASKFMRESKLVLDLASRQPQSGLLRALCSVKFSYSIAGRRFWTSEKVVAADQVSGE
jgi:hypothetical protein